ncbi:hypothetical protein KBA63_01585 [Candidatus Woesebacteria bacterium]|nr:hypothetical protein [Candidatus Woesebacteria bacterium]MBP9687144.1 hypothetical protein [Candidatus Woesebacteria bacterium]
MSAATAILHYVAPRESNNYKARLLHTPYLFLATFSLILVQFVITHAPGVPLPHGDVLGYAAQINLSEVIRLTNAKRAENGLAPVTENPSLDAAARAKGADMLAKGYWAHVAPDGTEPWDFFRGVQYKYRYAGENLARDFSSASGAVEGWMASPSHRENMLSPKYKDIGVAVVEGSLNGKDATIVVQLFGTLASEPAVVPVAAAKNNDETKPAVAQAQAPKEVPEPKIAGDSKISEDTTTSKINNSFDISKVVSLSVLILLSIIFVVDAIVISRRNIYRHGGKRFGHLTFLGIVIIVLVIAKAGQIL